MDCMGESVNPALLSLISKHHSELAAAGAPHPNLSKGMEEEHCVKAGCDDEFVSTNYDVRTTPLKEYEIATSRRECPPKDMLDKKGRKVRIVRDINELKMLKLAQTAGLVTEEIMAVVWPLSVKLLCAADLSHCQCAD